MTHPREQSTRDCFKNSSTPKALARVRVNLDNRHVMGGSIRSLSAVNASLLNECSFQPLRLMELEEILN